MAEIVHQEVIDIQVKNGDKNIKDLRKQIKELKDEIANLSLNGKDATAEQKQLAAANKELASAMAEVNKVIVDNISDTDTSTMSYNQMSKELSTLRKAAKDAGDAISRQKYSARIQELDKALKSMDAEMGVFNRNVGNYSEGVEKGTASMRQQIKDLRDELTKLTPETEEYAKKLVELAQKQRTLADIQEEAKFASQDYGDRLATITKVGTNLASGFAAVQGAMALFGGESENLGKVLVKLQAIMALVQGLDGLDGLGKNIQGLSRSFAPAIQAVKSFIGGLSGMKAAIAATGIGLLVTGLGAVAANWESIKAALGGTDENKLTEDARTSGRDFYQEVLEKLTMKSSATNSDRDAIWKAIFGTTTPTKEDKELIITQLYNRGQKDEILKQIRENSVKRETVKGEIRAILANYGLDLDSFIEELKDPAGNLQTADRTYLTYLKHGITGEDAKTLKASIPELFKLQKNSDKLYEDSNELMLKWQDTEWRINEQRLKEGKDAVNIFFPWNAEELEARINAIKNAYDEEEKLKDEHLKRLAAVEGLPEETAAENARYEEALANLHKKQNEDAEKAAKELAEKQAKVQERFAEEGLIAEIEARKRQYAQDLALFKNNAEMRKKLTIEYYADLQLIDRKYLKKYAEESASVYDAEYQKRVASLQNAYVEAAAQPSGDTPTQMEVAQPSAWTEDTVLAYAAETAAAQAFYESEIGYQNTVMQNQITILTNMRDIAREMGNTDAAVEYTRQINVLQDAIAANDTKVAEQRVVNQQNIGKAQKATNKEGEVTKWSLENMLSMGQSVGKIFGSVANMMDKNSEEGLAAYKAFATASAIIDTIASAVAAYKSLAGIPVAGPALGAAAAAAAVAAGMANVMQIQKTTLGSTANVENSYGASSVNAPDINAWEPQYTRNLQTDTETDELNKPIYVTVTDIQKGLNKQAKVVDSAKF
nr:MAG TPA: tail length tape measure protein [Caudoviricetes sp.]